MISAMKDQWAIWLHYQKKKKKGGDDRFRTFFCIVAEENANKRNKEFHMMRPS